MLVVLGVCIVTLFVFLGTEPINHHMPAVVFDIFVRSCFSVALASTLRVLGKQDHCSVLRVFIRCDSVVRVCTTLQARTIIAW